MSSNLSHWLLSVMASTVMAVNVHAQADTTIVRTLHKKAFSFLNSYPDSLLYYRDSSFHLAEKLSDQFGIAESFTDLGIYHWVKGNYSAAIHAYDTSNQIFIHIGRVDKQMNNFLNLGMVYSRLGDFPKAINYFLESLRLSEAVGSKETQAKAYNSLGVAYKNQGNLKEALAAYDKALTLFHEISNKESVAGSFSNIGNIYVMQRELDRGLEFHMKSLAIFDSLQNPRGMVTCYNNISDVYTAKKNYTEALQYREKALTLSKAKGFFVSEISALSGVGVISTELKDYARAEKSFLDAIDLAHQKNYRTEIVNLYKGISACYKAMGKPKEALAYHEKYATLKDSLYNQQSLVTISNLQIAHDLQKKEASIQLMKKDHEIDVLYRNRAIMAAVALFFIAALIVILQRQKLKKDRLLFQQQQKLHETEQALIQAQLTNARIKEDELLKEISYKNKSLTTYALSMVQKNEMLEEVKESVELILKKPDNQAEHFKKLGRLIDYGFTLDKDWEDFRLYFEEVHSDFFDTLRERFTDLGQADLKLCALIRLNLNVKQAATILRISPDSVKVARYRLRKKFNMQTEDNLTEFIMSI